MAPLQPEDERRKKTNTDPFADPMFAGLAPFLRNFHQDFERMQSEMQGLMRRALEAQASGVQGEPFVFGFSMKVGPDGNPRLEHFGNVAPTPGGVPSEGREPLTDVLETDHEITVTCELPGISKEDVNLHVSVDRITVRVDSPRKYHKVIPLPATVIAKSAKATFKNGVLDLTVQRKENRRDPGERIRIE